MLESSFSWKKADFLGLSLPSIVSSLEEMVHRNARIGGKADFLGLSLMRIVSSLEEMVQIKYYYHLLCCNSQC